MSERIAFHRKYRPVNISEYIGESTRNILNSRFLDGDRMPRTILLHGNSGCGKTTAARLIAKEYNCLSKVNGHACGECQMCQEIEENLIMGEAGVEAYGVTELDIATDSGKAAIEEALEEALIEPMYPLKYKVLILDECHMASKAAQNRLLKVVEEPPKHLVFIFCTTDPDSLLDTLKGRCQLKAEIRKPSVDDIIDRLLYVCEQEGITTSKEALRAIVKKAERVPREALNILENVADQYNGDVILKNVNEYIGAISDDLYFNFYASANKSLESILSFTQKLKERGVSYRDFIKGLTRFTLDCVYARYGIGIDEFSSQYFNSIKKLFGVYNQREINDILIYIEHANKIIDNKNEKGELIIITTAMRVSKLGLLKNEVNVEQEVAKEDKKSIKLYKENYKQEKLKKTQTVGIDVSDNSLASTFGSNIVNVKGEEDIVDNTKESEEFLRLAEAFDIDL